VEQIRRLLLDASLLTTLISGFLYILGYQYLFHYYECFRLNIQVREPDIPLVLSQGFNFAWYLIGAILVAIAAGYLVRLVVARFVPRLAVPAKAQLPSIYMICGILTFMGMLIPIESQISDRARQDAQKAIHDRQTLPQDIVQLKDGSILSGDLRFFFFGKTQAVFLDFLARTSPPPPRVVIVQLSEIKVLRTN
jgi:hypothetical protein